MLTGEKRKASFFDSHPMTPDRVANINAEAEKIAWSPQAPIASDQREFLQKLDGLWFDENPAQGVFRDDQFYQPDLGFTLTFPRGVDDPEHAELRGSICGGAEGCRSGRDRGRRRPVDLRSSFRGAPLRRAWGRAVGESGGGE